MVTWQIECEEIGMKQLVQAPTHEAMVKTLTEKGFDRILKEDEPFQHEPLFMTDKHGREWDAMPESLPLAERIPDGAFDNAKEGIS